MKAIVWTKYGPPDALQLREVEKPTPKSNEVLIRIYATTVTAGDCQVRGLNFPMLFQLPIRLFLGLAKPKRITILGQELAGEIEVVGKDVTRFRKGDQVFAWTGFRLGAYAEYACLPERAVVAIKPSNTTYEEAATLPIGGLEAVYFMRRANIQRGQKVLINGASGSIGTLAIQLAKYFGANVTAVASTGKLDFVRALGADHVIDYTRQDFTRYGESYDVIFDVIGKSPFYRTMKALRQGGLYLMSNARLSHRLLGRWASKRSSKRLIYWADRSAGEMREDLDFLKGLIEAEKIKPIVDRRYPLEQMAEAHRYVERGLKRGNIAITVGRSNWS